MLLCLVGCTIQVTSDQPIELQDGAELIVTGYDVDPNGLNDAAIIGKEVGEAMTAVGAASGNSGVTTAGLVTLGLAGIVATLIAQKKRKDGDT
jgi:hypothetical protein